MVQSEQLVVLFIFLFLLFLAYMYIQMRIKNEEGSEENVTQEDNKEPLLGVQFLGIYPTRQEEIPTVSSGVPNTTIPVTSEPWSTHSALSQITISGAKDMRPGYNDPPPPYSEAISSAYPRIDSPHGIPVTLPEPIIVPALPTTARSPAS